MNITTGKVARAQKVVIYGTEGIGKSTFASLFPNPLFIDTEGSTGNMDVARLDKPNSLAMLQQQIQFVKTNRPCGTLVVDTLDWAERLMIESVCQSAQKESITQFGYGEGFIRLEEEFGRFLNSLDDLINAGINIVLTAHAKITKFEQPDEMGAYDRYELKLGNKTTAKTAALAKEWADMVLFANYKTFSVATDDKGTKHKGTGGVRTMYANHHPAWDAKNRHGLPDEFPMDYGKIAHIFNQPVQQAPQTPPVQQQATDTPLNPNEPLQQQLPPSTPEPQPEAQTQDFSRQEKSLPAAIPQGLQDLMISVGMTFDELVEIAFARGHFPQGTPPESFPTEYYEGAIMANWDQVLGFYAEIKKTKAF